YGLLIVLECRVEIILVARHEVVGQTIRSSTLRYDLIEERLGLAPFFLVDVGLSEIRGCRPSIRSPYLRLGLRKVFHRVLEVRLDSRPDILLVRLIEIRRVLVNPRHTIEHLLQAEIVVASKKARLASRCSHLTVRHVLDTAEHLQHRVRAGNAFVVGAPLLIEERYGRVVSEGRDQIDSRLVAGFTALIAITSGHATVDPFARGYSPAA